MSDAHRAIEFKKSLAKIDAQIPESIGRLLTRSSSAAWVVSQGVVGVEHDPIHAVITAGQQLAVPFRKLISHLRTVRRPALGDQNCPEGATGPGEVPEPAEKAGRGGAVIWSQVWLAEARIAGVASVLLASFAQRQRT